MTQTPQIQKKRFFTRKRLGIGLGTVITLIALFGLLGYYWLPGFAKSQVELHLSEFLERPVTVGTIEIKPYTLELSVTGFRIGERADSVDASETFLAFDRLYVDISSESITQRAPVISAILLDTPRIRLVRDDENTFNISDLIEKFSQPSEDEEQALFSVSNIELRNGHIEWMDRFKQDRQTISDINFSVPFVANLDKVKADWVKPHFSARIDGALFLLEGQIRPFADKREATLSLNLADADLTGIAGYLPFPAGISLLSGHFDSDLTVTFSQSNEESTAMTLTGEFGMNRVAIQNQTVEIPYQLELGNFNLSLDQFDLTGEEPSSLVFSLGDIAISPLSGQVDSKESVLSLRRLAVDEAKLDLTGKQIVLNTITLDQLKSMINRDIDGNLELMRFFSLADEPESKASVPQSISIAVPVPRHKPSYEELASLAENAEHEEQTTQKDIEVAGAAEVVETTEDKPWTVAVNQFRLTGAAIHYTDRIVPESPPMIIDPLDILVENIDVSGEKPLDLQMTARVNDRGSIASQGKLAWSPLVADLNLNLKTVDLVSLQGWVSESLNVLLTSGDFSFDGNVRAGGNPLKVEVGGQTQLGNFNILDPKLSRDILRWKNIDVSGLEFFNEPLKIAIDSIKLGGFYAHAVLLPNGELNLKHIVRQDKASVEGETKIPDDEGGKTKDTPLPLHIGKVVLQQGTVDFYDRFIRPNYHANLTGLHGQIGPIQAQQIGEIDIKGSVDKTAPLEISGRVDPFGAQLFLDLVAKVKDIELPAFSPYSGKYVGYGIEKGKLSVDVHYHIEEGALTAENNVFLDQLTLGERIESEEALSLPLELAIALLKNQRGEIDIHLPVKGSLDDPQFSLGSIILDAFVNLITRAVTAPFALLGSMMGQEEELSEIRFASGSAAIDARAGSRLQALSQVLRDRPALRLEIAGHVDPVSDYEGLKGVNLQRQIAAKKLSDEAKKGETGGAVDEVKLSPEEYSQYLEVVYKAADFEKPTNFLGFTKSIADEEMEQLLLQHIEVSEDELNELAQERAQAAQSWLQEQGEIAGDRLFVIGAKQSENDGKDDNDGSRVMFKLK